MRWRDLPTPPKISVIRRLPQSRRLATLVAFVSNLEAVALDELALDLLEILITEIFSDAARASDKARLRTIKDLDAAAIQLTQVSISAEPVIGG
jgi:histone H3/H4